MLEQVSQIATVFDSEEQHVGQVYAKALLQAAMTAGNKVDAVVDQLDSIVRDVLDKNPGIELAMSNPKMSVEEKSAFFDRVFGSKMEKTLLNFLKVLARRHRLTYIRAISRSALEQRDEAAGRLQVQVTTSTPLDTKSSDALKAKLKTTFNKEIRLLTKVDPSILGGLVVRIGDTVYDGSVDGQLKALRREAGAKAEATIRGRSSQLTSS